MSKVVTRGPWEPYGGYECGECGGTVDQDAMLVSRKICPLCGEATTFEEQPVRARRWVQSRVSIFSGPIEGHWEYKDGKGAG